MSAVLSQARKEWGLIKENPMADVRKPAKPPARDRRPSSEELERLAHSAGSDLSHSTARAYQAFLFAIETAMRAGEIIGLTWENVDLGDRVCHLPKTKNGTSRDVGLSPEAVRLLVMVDRGHRELPIQPDFCGRVVPTSRKESVQLCLAEVDGVEGVYLLKD